MILSLVLSRVKFNRMISERTPTIQLAISGSTKIRLDGPQAGREKYEHRFMHRRCWCLILSSQVYLDHDLS